MPALNLLHERPVHMLSYSVLLRGLRGSSLVPNALGMEEASELPHVLSLVVSPHDFQHHPSLPVDVGMKLLELV